MTEWRTILSASFVFKLIGELLFVIQTKYRGHVLPFIEIYFHESNEPGVRTFKNIREIKNAVCGSFPLEGLLRRGEVWVCFYDAHHRS